MDLRNLFVVTHAEEHEKGAPVAAARTNAVGVFVTPKSLLAFPIASFAVALIASVLKKIFPTFGGSVWVPVGSAFFIGLVIFLTTISSPAINPKGARQWFIAISVGVVNCLYLVATALGLLTVGSK
jgi:hypothetical protein